MSLHSFSLNGREKARGGVCFTFTCSRDGHSKGKQTLLHHQLGGCTGALDQELSLMNILLFLAGDSLMSQASYPGSLKEQVKSRIEGNSLDFALITRCDTLKN